VHLHGHNVGYKGRNLREVRDVQKDQIEQQLQASQRRMIAVLPQGSATSVFGITNPDHYLADVFAGLTAIGAWGPNLAPPISRVILSGHSGAGAPISRMLRAGPANAISNMGGLFLFDAINGPNEQRAVLDWLARQFRHDLAELTGSRRVNNPQEQRVYLSSSIRLRGFFTPGHYARLYQPVIAAINDWFGAGLIAQLTASGLQLDQGVITQWRQNYVLLPAGHDQHDYIVGTGRSALPGRGGPGALFDALSALPPGTQSSPTGQTQANPQPARVP
jgi:hypothetical protein